MAVEENEFVKQAFEEISEMENREFESNEKIRKLLSGKDEKYASVMFGEVEIRFNPFVGKRLRHKMMQAKKEIDKDTTSESGLAKSERLLYDTLGSLCVDDPFDNWKTWAYIDEKGDGIGGVQRIFLLIMSELGKYNEDVKNFR
jgi:hypothetical protein